MREEYRLKYISNRIFLIAVIIFLYFAEEAVRNVLLELRGEETMFRACIHVLIALLYFLVVWFGVVLPYRRSELLVRRFLEGYLTESRDFAEVFQSPSMKRQMDEIEKILRSPKMIDLNKRQAQYLALQNQINPHFLYNTLESIRGEALIAGLSGVADMTEALAKFFRYTITNVENLVTVQDELDNCETYFLIQKYRFGERLQLHVDYDSEDWEDIIAIAAGDWHTVGLRSDGTVVSTKPDSDKHPGLYLGACNVEGADWTNIIEISAGCGITVGLKEDGSVIAVGYNDHRQCDIARSWKDLFVPKTD